VNITSPQENDKQFFRESLVHQQEKSEKEKLDTRRSPPHTKEKKK
jgi:hypothetical protein